MLLRAKRATADLSNILKLDNARQPQREISQQCTVTYCLRTSRLILCVNHKDTALQSSVLVSFGLLNHNDVVASKVSNGRLVLFIYFSFRVGGCTSIAGALRGTSEL